MFPNVLSFLAYVCSVKLFQLYSQIHYLLELIMHTNGLFNDSLFYNLSDLGTAYLKIRKILFKTIFKLEYRSFGSNIFISTNQAKMFNLLFGRTCLYNFTAVHLLPIFLPKSVQNMEFVIGRCFFPPNSNLQSFKYLFDSIQYQVNDAYESILNIYHQLNYSQFFTILREL